MKREEKYPETDVFRFYNHNPKKRITTDCLIRAISYATGIPYNQVVMDAAKLQCENGFDLDSNMDKLMGDYGWIRLKQPRRIDNTKMSIGEFCRYVKTNKYFSGEPIVAYVTGNHATCIVNNKIHDIWDCSEKTIGKIWVKK